jgi:O-antigen/teichoic acid export membrane protein
MTTTTSEPRTAARPSAVRSGALIAAASLVATGLNYVFLLAVGRTLGPDSYGDFAALLALLTVVLLPSSAVQLAVSREVSRRVATGDADGAEAFSRGMFRLGLIATAPLLAAGLVFVIPLRDLLGIQSTSAVVIAVSGLLAALLFPIATGVLQGYQRFHSIALLYVLPFALRLGFLALLAWVGYRLGGALFAAVAGGVVSTVVAIGLLRETLRRGAQTARPAFGPFLRYLWPVVVGLIGIAVLTNVDLLVVKARFPDDAGEYAAAAAFARVAFFLPATILAVLFPRTAERQARGEDTADILGRSLIVTAAFGGLLALFYWMTGRGLVHTSFGAEFAAGGGLLVPFTVSLALFALANVLVGFHLSRGETRYAWIVAAFIPVQIVVLSLVPSSVHGVIWADIALGVGLIAAHEALVGSSRAALAAGVRQLRAETHVGRRVVVEGLLVVGGAIAFVCALFAPLMVHFSSTILGKPGSDSTGSVWSFWRMRHEDGFHLLGSTHHTLTGAPFGWDEGNGLNVQWLLPYYPTSLLARVVGEVTAYNVATLSGYVLSAVAMYALVRYLGCSIPVSAWAAIAYVVFPWHLLRVEHASLVHIEVLALLVLTLVGVTRSPSWTRWGLVAVAVLACWFTSGYYGTIAVITTFVFTAAYAATSPWRDGVRLAVGATVGALGASTVVGIAAVVSGVGRGGGLLRGVGDVSGYGLKLLALILPASGNVVLGHSLDAFRDAHVHGGSPAESTAYLGLLTIGLALGWVVVVGRSWQTCDRRLRSTTVALATVAVVGLLFALPSPSSVFGLEVRMPSRYLFDFTPAFRVPTRWIPLVMTVVLPLAALGLQRAWRDLGRYGRGAQAALVGGALVLSFLELAVWPAHARFRTTPVPPEYAAVERTPPGILAEYPLGSSDLYLLWQRDHGRRLLNGAPPGTSADDARRMLLDPAAAGTASQLAFLGVSSIVLHAQGHADVEVQPQAPKPGDGYALVAKVPDGSTVWQVTAPEAPALVTLTGGFALPTATSDGSPGYALDSPAGVATVELTSREDRVVRLVFDAIPPAGAKRTLRVADDEHEVPFVLSGRTEVSTLVEVPRGTSYVLVKTDPAATSEEDAVVLVAPRAERASGEPQIHAQTISPDPGL